MKNYFLITILFFSNLFAQEVENPLGLAALLVQGQSYEKAIIVLEKMGNDLEDEEQTRRDTLMGLAYLGLRKFDQSITYLNEALKSENPQPEVKLYLAKAYTGAEKFDDVIKTLDARTSSEMVRVYSNALWKLGQFNFALKELNQSLSKFPTDEQLYKQVLFYLVELKLYQSAVTFFETTYKSSFPLSGQDYVEMAFALKDSLIPNADLIWLEKANVLFPEDQNVLLALANSYHLRGHNYLAAMIFDKLAQWDSKYFVEASELYRRAGHIMTALARNNEVRDHKAKLEQRFVLYLDLQDVEKMTSMQSQMQLNGLMEKDELRYAMAWAQFESGRFKQAQSLISKITDQNLYEKAQGLRKQILECQQEVFKCVY